MKTGYTPLALVAVLATALVSAQERSPPAASRDGRIIDLRDLPYRITEPGAYVLDRDWRLAASPTNTVIEIAASDVTVDLRSFAIVYEGNGDLIEIDGNDVAIRNGRLAAPAAAAIDSRGSATTIEALEVEARDGLAFSGGQTRMLDSLVRARFGMFVTENSTIERSRIGCCLALRGDGNKVIAGQLLGGDDVALAIEGDGNLVASNVIEGTTGSFAMMAVRGDDNLVRDNTLLAPAGQQRPLVVVDGAANTLDGNIALPPADGERPAIGIAFTRAGNRYGDNRLAAAVPFDLGNTRQIDWGGNVGF